MMSIYLKTQRRPAIQRDAFVFLFQAFAKRRSPFLPSGFRDLPPFFVSITLSLSLSLSGFTYLLSGHSRADIGEWSKKFTIFKILGWKLPPI